MLLIRDDFDAFNGETVLTIGKFDGLHLAHQMLVKQIKERAAILGVKSGMITFDPHPATVLKPEGPPPLLTTLEEKEAILTELGLDLLVLLTFNRQTMQTRAADYLQYLVDGLRPRELWVGADFAMGYKREGNVEFIRQWAEPRGIAVHIIPLQEINGEIVSGTRIRNLIAEGQVEHAARLLGRPPSITAIVQKGDQRGRTIGFPTTNLIPTCFHALPPNGVYASRTRLPNGALLPSVTNVGIRPTFNGQQQRVESHILDWSGDLYGQQISIEFLHRLRAEKKFSGIQELMAQIRKDAEAARQYLNTLTP